MKTLFVILVTYRRFDHFRSTVESLLPTLPEGSKVVVVYNREGRHEDDLRYHGYFAALTAEHSNVEVLDTGANEGWGASMNEGLAAYPEWRDHDFVLESNNDVSYSPGWFKIAREHMDARRSIGILGLWKHPHHGTRQEFPDGLLVRDNMPACAWLFRSVDLAAFLPFAEKGACGTRGGNGEDSDMVEKVQAKGMWVCGLGDDLAEHMDGYDLPDLGKPNPAYD